MKKDGNIYYPEKQVESPKVKMPEGKIYNREFFQKLSKNKKSFPVKPNKLDQLRKAK